MRLHTSFKAALTFFAALASADHDVDNTIVSFSVEYVTESQTVSNAGVEVQVFSGLAETFTVQGGTGGEEVNDGTEIVTWQQSTYERIRYGSQIGMNERLEWFNCAGSGCTVISQQDAAGVSTFLLSEYSVETDFFSNSGVNPVDESNFLSTEDISSYTSAGLNIQDQQFSGQQLGIQKDTWIDLSEESQGQITLWTTQTLVNLDDMSREITWAEVQDHMDAPVSPCHLLRDASFSEENWFGSVYTPEDGIVNAFVQELSTEKVASLRVACSGCSALLASFTVALFAPMAF